eukprot:COSAG05_NODE_12295_length_473_cov_2.010695_1_plen_28_part_01
MAGHAGGARGAGWLAACLSAVSALLGPA